MSVLNVVKSHNCMSCGACSSQCPVDAIDIVYVAKEGFYRPRISKKNCIECGKCEKICPALHQDSDSLIGDYYNLFLAHAQNEKVRRYSTSGGVINTFVRYIINNEIVDAVLLCIHDAKNPIETTPTIINQDNVELLLNNPRLFASRYVSVPLISELRNAFDNYGRIAVVGTPCHLKAVELFEKTNKVRYESIKLGVTCSGGTSYKATMEYKRKTNLTDSEIYYRGDGWPGKNILIQGEKKIEYPHTASLFEKMFTSQIFKNPGCKGCKDHFAECSDISFCDYWNRDEMNSEKIGNSCVIIRTERAKNLFDRLYNDNQIEIVKELNEDNIIITQLRALKAKKSGIDSEWKYRLFNKVCYFVFKTRIFRLFGVRCYRIFGRYYLKLCNSRELTMIKGRKKA